MPAAGDEMMSGAPDEGQMRASHADRERVIDTLKAAFVQGRLAKKEFDLRIGQVLASRTYSDLAVLTADLPAGLAKPQRPDPTAPVVSPPPVNKPLLWGSWAVVLLTLGFMLGASFVNYVLALVVGVFPLLVATPIAGTLTLDAWREKRSHGQLPPRPQRSGRALEVEHGGMIEDDLTTCETREDVSRQPAPARSRLRRATCSVIQTA